MRRILILTLVLVLAACAAPTPTPSLTPFQTQTAPPPATASSQPTLIQPTPTGTVTALPGPSATPPPTASQIPTASTIPTLTLPILAQYGSGQARGAAWSPDGKTIAVLTAQGINLHDAKNLRLIRQLRETTPVEISGPIAFMADGRHIAVGITNGWEMWDMDSGVVSLHPSLSGDPITRIVPFPYGAQVAAIDTYPGRLDVIDSILILDATDGHELARLDDQEAYRVNNIALSPDGRWLAAACDDGQLRVWDTTQLQQRAFAGHVGSITDVAFSADGKTIISAGVDATVRWWDVASGKQVRSINHLSDTVEQIGVDSQGKLFALKFSGGRVEIHDTTRVGLRGVVLGVNGRLVGFSPDGQRVLTAGWSTAVQVWDWASAQPLQVDAEPLYLGATSWLAVSSDGQWLIMSSGKEVWRYNTQTGEPSRLFGLPHAIRRFIANPRSPVLAVPFADDGEVWMVDLSSGAVLQKLATPSHAVYALAFDPSGTILAAAGKGDVVEWDWSTGRVLRTLTGINDAQVDTLGYSSDGQALYSVHGDGTVEAWNLNNGERQKILQFEPDTDGRTPSWLNAPLQQMVVGGYEHFNFWNLVTRERYPAGQELSGPTDLVFSPDGRLVVALYGSSIFLIDSANGQIMAEVPLSTVYTSFLALSPDGHRLYLATSDGAAYSLDATQLQALEKQIPTYAPAPTSTPAAADQTATPTLSLTPLPLPTSAANVISAANAAELTRTKQIGLGTLSTARLSPDGKQVAVAGSLGAFILDAATLSVINQLPMNQPVQCATFAPDGALLVTTASGTVRWDIRSNLSTQVAPPCESFSPDGTLAINFDKSQAGFIVRKYPGEQFVAKLQGSATGNIKISPDDRLAASGGDGNTVRIWDLPSGRVAKTLIGHTRIVDHVAFSPDSHILASGGEDGQVLLADLSTGALLHEFDLGTLGLDDNGEPFANRIVGLAFSPDGQWLATASWDNIVRIWNVGTGEQKSTLTDAHGYIRSLFFDQTGQKLYAVSDDAIVRTWDIETGQLLASSHGFLSGVKAVTFEQPNAGILSDGPSVYHWSLDTGLGLRILPEITGTVTNLSRNGQWLAESLSPLVFRLWDVGAQTATQTFKSELQGLNLMGHDYTAVDAVMFPAVGNQLISSGNVLAPRLWDMGTGSKILDYQGGTHFVGFASLDISPDSKLVAASTYESNPTVFVWQVQTGALLRQFTLPGAGPGALAFSPDGLRLAVGGDQLSVWDINTGQMLQRSAASADILAFSPDGKLLAVGQKNGQLGVFDATTLTSILQVQVLEAGFDSGVEAVVFSPDGRSLLTGGPDGVAWVWSIQAPK